MPSSPKTAYARIPMLFSILLLLLALSPEAFAVNCNSPPTGSYGPAWAREYQSWCVACCGIFSMSGGNPSCSPGSNWGCKGQGSSGATPGMYNTFYQSGYQIGQGIGKLLFGDPQAEARKRAQAEMEAQRAMQQNRQMLQSLDDMSKEQVRQEDQASIEAAAQARLLGEQQQQETLASLKGIPQTDAEITLKPSTDFFGIPGNPKGDLSSLSDPSLVDLRHLDPNKPITVDQNVLREGGTDKQKQKGGTRIMDCGQGRLSRDRLAAGLPVQLEVIKRTESQLKAAGKGIEEAKAESRRVLLKSAIQEAKAYAQEVLTSAKALRLQIEMLKGLDKTKRDTLIRAVNAMAFGGEDLVQSAKGGYKGGEALKKKVDDLSSQIATLSDKLLMESGIAEKAGEELSGKLWGPVGQLGFRGAKLSIDLSVALGNGMISKADQQAALRNLDIMRGQYERVKQRMSELDRDLRELCKEKPQARK